MWVLYSNGIYISCGLQFKVFSLLFLSMTAVCVHNPFVGTAWIDRIMELLSGYKFFLYISEVCVDTQWIPRDTQPLPTPTILLFWVDLIYLYVSDNCSYFIFSLHHWRFSVCMTIRTESWCQDYLLFLPLCDLSKWINKFTHTPVI